MSATTDFVKQCFVVRGAQFSAAILQWSCVIRMSMPFQDCFLPTCFLPSYTVEVDFTNPAEAIHRAISARVPALQTMPKVFKPFDGLEIGGTCGGCAGDGLRCVSAAVVDSEAVMIKKQHGVNTSLSNIRRGHESLRTDGVQANCDTLEHQLGSALIGQLPREQWPHNWTIRPHIVPVPVLNSVISTPEAFPPELSKTIEDTKVPMFSMQYASILSSNVLGNSGADSCSRFEESVPRLLQPHQILPKIIEHILPEAPYINRLWQCVFVPEPALKICVVAQELRSIRAFETAIVKDVLVEDAPVTLCCSLLEHVKNQLKDSSKKCQHTQNLVHVELRARQSCTKLKFHGQSTCFVECLLTVLADNQMDGDPRSSGVIPVL